MGRVLLSGYPGKEIGQPDFFIKREMVYEIRGTRIPRRKLKLDRFIKQEDADDPGSAYEYRAEAEFADDRRSELTPADREVLGALTDEPQTTKEVAKHVDLHPDTVRDSLKDLAKYNLAEHDSQKKAGGGG